MEIASRSEAINGVDNSKYMTPLRTKDAISKAIANSDGGSGSVVGDTVPVGAGMWYPSNTIPENWLLCDGQAVSRVTYSELFAVLGTSHGAGDGSTTFNLPNIKGRTIVGKNNVDAEMDLIGETIGSKYHKHLLPIGCKDAGDNVAIDSNAYANGYADKTTGISWIRSAIASYFSSGLNIREIKSYDESTMQPSIVENYIIKAKQSAGVVATVVDGFNSSSATDASSAKNAKELNDKFTKHMLNLKLANDQTFTTSAGWQSVNINLSQNIIVGNKLSYDSVNKAIKIGAGVSKVMINANMRAVYGWNSSFKLLMICKNGAAVATATTTGNDSITCAITPIPITVAENDLIDLKIQTSVAESSKGISNASTYLTVEVIE